MTEFPTNPDDYEDNLFDSLSKLVAKEGRRRGEALAEAGANTAMMATPEYQLAIADKVIIDLAKTGREFSGNDVRPLVGAMHQPKALGNRFKVAAKAGIIEAVGYTRSSDPISHAALIRTWRGTGNCRCGAVVSA